MPWKVLWAVNHSNRKQLRHSHSQRIYSSLGLQWGVRLAGYFFVWTVLTVSFERYYMDESWRARTMWAGLGCSLVTFFQFGCCMRMIVLNLSYSLQKKDKVNDTIASVLPCVNTVTLSWHCHDMSMEGLGEGSGKRAEEKGGTKKTGKGAAKKGGEAWKKEGRQIAPRSLEGIDAPVCH